MKQLPQVGSGVSRVGMWGIFTLHAALLAGCATNPPTQEVKIPVYVSCVKNEPARPTFATSTLALDASDGEKVLALARDKPTHLKYEGALEAVIAGCK